MKIYWTLLAKDLRLELRTRQTIISTLVFAALMLIVFNFSFELRDVDLISLGPGVLWVTFLFNGVLVLERVFASERENAAIDGLALAPIDRGAIFAAKWTFATLLMLVAELAVLLEYGAVLNQSAFSPLIVLVMILATAGFSAAGTAIAVVAFNSRAREVMLPLLLLPLTVPVVIAAVRSTSMLLAGEPARSVLPWLNLMLAFDVLVGAVCYYTFGALLDK